MTARALPKHEPIESLIADLREALADDVVSNFNFDTLLTRCFTHALATPKSLALDVGYATDSEYRAWARGKSCPLADVRGVILSHLLKMAEREAAR